MLLPSKMPNISKSFNIEDWTKDNIINKLKENATYTLNMVALVDLRKLFSYKNVSHGNTVFDILSKDKTFLTRLFPPLGIIKSM